MKAAPRQFHQKTTTSVLIELCRDGCGVDISYISHVHFTSLLESLFWVSCSSTCFSHQGAAKLYIKLCHTAIATSSHLSCLYVCSYDDCFLLSVKGTFQDAATHLWIWSTILVRSDLHVHLGEATYQDLYVCYPLAVTLSLARTFWTSFKGLIFSDLSRLSVRPPSHLSSCEDRRHAFDALPLPPLNAATTYYADLRFVIQDANQILFARTEDRTGLWCYIIKRARSSIQPACYAPSPPKVTSRCSLQPSIQAPNECVATK